MIIRDMHHGERHMLKDFLYDAIFVPDDRLPPDKSIIERPELQVYIENFGGRESDRCLVAEVNGEPVDAVWTRIMYDYVQKANYAVRMYVKLGFEIFSENDDEYIMLMKL